MKDSRPVLELPIIGGFDSDPLNMRAEADCTIDTNVEIQQGHPHPDVFAPFAVGGGFE